MRTYLLFNPYAGNGKATSEAKNLCEKLGIPESDMVDMTAVKSYAELFAGMEADARIVIIGGDGTLNRFVNDTDGLEIAQSIWHFPAGTGNDFCNDLGTANVTEPFEITKYLKDLPTVEVNGMTRKFLNGIGFGIDRMVMLLTNQETIRDVQLFPLMKPEV